MNIIHDVTANSFSLPSDIVWIILLVVVAFVYIFWRGKSKGVSLVLSVYPAILLYTYLPFFKQYTTFSATTQSGLLIQAAIFFIFLIFSHLVVNRFIEPDFSFSKVGKSFDALILGILSAGLLIWTSYHVVVIGNVYAFSPSIAHAFASNLSFWWLLAPFVVLFFL